MKKVKADITFDGRTIEFGLDHASLKQIKIGKQVKVVIPPQWRKLVGLDSFIAKLED